MNQPCRKFSYLDVVTPVGFDMGKSVNPTRYDGTYIILDIDPYLDDPTANKKCPSPMYGFRGELKRIDYYYYAYRFREVDCEHCTFFNDEVKCCRENI